MHTRFMHPVFIYIPITALCIGIFISRTSTILSVGIGFIFLIIAIIFFKQKIIGTKKIVIGLCFTLLFFGYGFFMSGYFHKAFYDAQLETFIGETVSCTGVIREYPDIRETRIYLIIHTTQCEYRETFIPSSVSIRISLPRLSAETDETVFHYGQELLITGKIEKPEPFITDSGRLFHYDSFLYEQKIAYSMYQPEYLVTGNWNGSRVKHILFTIKSHTISSIIQFVKDPGSGLAIGMLVGDQSELSASWKDIFRKTGVMHLVVLSGYNAVIAASACMFLVQRLGRKYRYSFGILGIILFTIMVGAGASIVRAGIMVALGLGAGWFGRMYDPLRALCIGATIMIIINPLTLMYNISFHLSFLATFGIIVFGSVFEKLFEKIPNRFELRSTLVVTCVTQCTVLPYIIYSVGEISIVSFIANIFVVLAVPLIMLLSASISVATLFISSFAFILGKILDAILFIQMGIIYIFSQVPFASIMLPMIPSSIIIMCYGLCLIYTYYYYLPEKSFAYHSMRYISVHK